MEARYFKIGVFVIVALAIGVVFLIAFGAAGQGQALKFETYLSESVEGLEVGSPVRIQGVALGRVDSIGFVLTRYGVEAGLVRIVFSCRPQQVGQTNLELVHARLEKWVTEGFRVRLASGGLVGGTYLEMSKVDPEENPPLELTWDPEFVYIPSMPSVMNQLTADAMAIVADLKAVDIAGIGSELKSTLENLRETTEGLPGAVERLEKSLDEGVIRNLETLIVRFDGVVTDDLKPIVGNLNRLTTDLEPQLKTFMTELNSVLKDEVRPAIAGIRKTGDALPETVQRLDQVIAKLDILVRREGFDIQDSLRSLRGALADLKSLTDTAQRHPAAVLFGDPPPRSGRDRGK